MSDRLLTFTLINEGGASEYKTFEGYYPPSRGDILVLPHHLGGGTARLLVMHVEHHQGQLPRLHVKWHSC